MKFLLSEYSSFVQDLLKSGYECLPFSSPKSRQTSGKHLLLRHDLDIDPVAALPMASIEHSIGAQATYFVLLSNRHTNPLDREFRNAVQEIAYMGHWIGLHFDATQYGLRAADPEFSNYVRQEAQILESTTGVVVDSVSFHRPAKELLSSPSSLTSPYVHTYENIFLREIEYCSDSSGQWGNGPPEDREGPRTGKPFHFLTHPVWWGSEDTNPISRISDWMALRVHQDFAYELPNEPNPFGGKS